MSGMRNSLLGINSRLDTKKENISKHEDTAIETTQNETHCFIKINDENTFIY